MSFIKLVKGEMLDSLLEHEPNCFLLLTQIAKRAKRTQTPTPSGLEVNQAYIGDYKKCGLTRQTYRTSLEKLKRFGLIAYFSTNKGTVVTITNTAIYDINVESANHPATIQQPTDNQQITTNKKERMEKKERKEPYSVEFLQFWNMYPKKVGKGAAYRAWGKIGAINGLLPQILQSIQDQKKGEQWCKENGQFIPHPSTWLNGAYWENEETEKLEEADGLTAFLRRHGKT